MTDDKELERLKLPPFPTMAEPSPSVVDKLRGWKPPPHAYILFEIRRRDSRSGETFLDLWAYNVENRPDQADKLSDIKDKKRLRVLHYGNFPSLNDPNPYRAAHARKHSGPMGENPYRTLEARCQHWLQGAHSPEVQAEINQLKAKEAAALKKVAELEAKKVEAKNVRAQ